MPELVVPPGVTGCGHAGADSVTIDEDFDGADAAGEVAWRLCRRHLGRSAECSKVANRWHIWHNLGEAVERVVARHRDCLGTTAVAECDVEPVIVRQQQTPVTFEVIELPTDRTDKWAVRTRERYAAVHAMLSDGVSIRAVSDQLGLARGTVRRFARASGVEELLVNHGTGRRPSLLQEFKPYLHQR
ncbi:hypothetical protein [Nocardia brasiliensis]|uniref:hypothetical protein n=1 Tax=Nocardia brasiliensis TaxID=37326 RepID=UPI0036708B2F